MTLVDSRTLLGLIPSLWWLMTLRSPAVEQEADEAILASPEPGSSSSSTGPPALGCLQVWVVLDPPRLHHRQQDVAWTERSPLLALDTVDVGTAGILLSTCGLQERYPIP